MKKLIILLVLLLTISISGCKEDKNDNNIDSAQYNTLVNLLNNPIFSDKELNFNVVINDKVSQLNSYSYNSRYFFAINSKLINFTSTPNSSIITKIDAITKEETIFSDNIEITSLDVFSTIILDSYESEFLYYNSKSLIPLALELIQTPDLSFTFQNDKFDYNRYMIEGTIDKLNLQDDFHKALLKSSNTYTELHDTENPSIKIVFNTDKDSKYLLSSMDFFINNQIIAQIK